MRFRPAFPLLCAATLAVMSSSPVAVEQAPVMAGYPSAGEPAIVKVVEPGAEPRRPLRYVVVPSHRTSAHLSLGMVMTVRLQGEKRPEALPTMGIGFDLGVTAGHPDGSISYDIRFTSVDVEDVRGTNPAAVAAMRTALSDLTGLTASATVSNRGASRAFQFDTDRLTDPRLKQAMSQVTSTMGDLSIPLPEEAVGPGATWEARQVHVTDGVHVFQKTEFTLESVEGPVVVLRSRLEQQAPSQLMSAADLPAGTTVRLKRLTGSGLGTITLRLDELVVSSTAELRSSAAMALTTQGRSEPMTLDLRLTLGLTPTR